MSLIKSPTPLHRKEIIALCFCNACKVEAEYQGLLWSYVRSRHLLFLNLARVTGIQYMCVGNIFSDALFGPNKSGIQTDSLKMFTVS